jgi:hypothetical protein
MALAAKTLLATVLLCCFLVMTSAQQDGDWHYHWRASIVRRHQMKVAATVGGDLVSWTCANASEHVVDLTIEVTAEACESMLRSDNRSAHAKDARDLALLAIDMVRLSAMAADSKAAAEEEGQRWGHGAHTPGLLYGLRHGVATRPRVPGRCGPAQPNFI